MRSSGPCLPGLGHWCVPVEPGMGHCNHILYLPSQSSERKNNATTVTTITSKTKNLAYPRNLIDSHNHHQHPYHVCINSCETFILLMVCIYNLLLTTL